MRTKEGNKEKGILEAAIKVFAEYGYSNAKISKIAEVAGIATGSVYLYFPNKEKIISTLFRQIWEKLAVEFENLVNKSGLTPIEKINGMIDLAFDVFSTNPALGIIFVNEQAHQKVTKEFYPFYEKFLDLGEIVLKTGVDENLFRNDFDLKICKYFIFGGLRQLINQRSQNPEFFSLEKIRENIKSLIKNGILINR